MYKLGSYTATMEWVTKIATGGGNDSPPPFTDEFSYTETGGGSTETSETYSDETSDSTCDGNDEDVYVMFDDGEPLFNDDGHPLYCQSMT